MSPEIKMLLPVLFPALFLLPVIRSWWIHRPCRVLYKDGQYSVVMPRWRARSYAECFGGKVVRVECYKGVRNGRWRRGVL